MGEIIDIAIRYRSIFLEGTIGTLQLAAITVFFGMLLGAVVAFMHMSKFKPLSWLAGLYVEVLRGTPLLVQLYIFYMFVPEMSPWIKSLDLPVYFYIVLSLVINSSAYVSEVIRRWTKAKEKRPNRWA